MNRILAKVRHFELPESARNILIIVSSLSIFDVLVVVAGASYLSQNVGAFIGKSQPVILSDLLFIEGSIILAVGIFIAVTKATQKIKQYTKQSTEATDSTEQTGEKRISIGMLLVIVGAILIALSVTVGTLLI